MSDRVPRRQRRCAPRNRDVEVAARHRQGPDQRLLRLGDLRVGDSRHAYRPASSNVSCLIPAFLSECSSIVNSVPRPDRSRAALIDTAATLFRRQGYAATGLNQILDEAAVKPGSLYHHFPRGKQQLAAAVVDGTGAAIEQLLRRFLAGGQPVADIVDRWVDAAGRRADRRPA